MKKIFALVLALIMVFALCACGSKAAGMSHEDYVKAELKSPVTVQTYVQATQSWWNDQITVYAQSKDGAYFIYNMACSEADAAKLVPGTEIIVKGVKDEWSGEVEIVDGSFELGKGSYIADVADVTALLGTDELITHQNEKVSFKGLTIEPQDDGVSAFYYNWDNSGTEGSDSDLYFNASINGQTFSFTVEYYLCNENTDVYKAVQNLKVGDTVDLEGFLYWYNGANPHITSCVVK